MKSLKIHTRTLNVLLAQHTAELAVLECIYYIDSNQNRPALFWQRVVEARRYFCRLRSLDVPSLVDSLRRHRVRTPGCIIHFGNPPAFRSSELRKRVWTHYPPAVYLESFLVRLRICIMFLDKVRRAPPVTFYNAELLTICRHAFVCA